MELRALLTDRAVEVLQRAPKVPESLWVVPAPQNPAEAVSIHVLNLWLQRTKARAGVNVKGLGFHGQKRAGVRRKEFRELPAKVQEALTGTNHETLRRIYDNVSLEESRQPRPDAAIPRMKAIRYEVSRVKSLHRIVP